MPPTDRDLRRERWGTRIALISAVTTVAVVIAGGIHLAGNTEGIFTITGGEPDQGQLAAPGDAVAAALVAPPFSYTIRGYSAEGLRVTDPVLVTPGYQEARIRLPYQVHELRDGKDKVVDTLPDHGALLTVYRPGVFDPSRWAAQEAIEVGRRPGHYAADLPYREQPGGERPRPGVAWQYADDAWAVISTVAGEPYPREALLRVAEKLVAVEPYPATTPIDLVTVPEGYTLTSGGAADDFPNGTHYLRASVRLVKDRPAYQGLAAPLDPAAFGTPAVRVALYDAAWSEAADGLEPGAPASCTTDRLCVKLSADGRWLAEASTGDGGPKRKVLTRMLDELVIADVTDRASWFPLTDAAS